MYTKWGIEFTDCCVDIGTENINMAQSKQKTEEMVTKIQKRIVLRGRVSGNR